jgi:hypothetical protein
MQFNLSEDETNQEYGGKKNLFGLVIESIQEDSIKPGQFFIFILSSIA